MALKTNILQKPQAALPEKINLPARPTRSENISYNSILGDSTSAQAMRGLKDYTKNTKLQKTVNHLSQAYNAFKKRDWQKGAQCSIEALKIDEKCGEAWHFLAVSREKCGDLNTAFTCFETALRLLPDNLNIAIDIGRLAYRLGHYDMAAKFFRFVLQRDPYHQETINNLCSALRETEEFDEAIETLQSAIVMFPKDAKLWNNIGTIMVVKGDFNTASLFFEEALKHDPKNVHALHNLGNIKTATGDIAKGRDMLLAALPLFDDMANIASAKLSIAYAYLALGQLKDGWEWHHARHKENTFEQMVYLIEPPRWMPGEDLPDNSLFISTEQGLGDEVMLASVLPDLFASKGIHFHWGIAVEKRLVSLFKRSFPNAEIFAHHTTNHNGRSVRLYPEVKDWSPYEKWALIADFLHSFRENLSQFPKKNTYLLADPKRVLYWQQQLSELTDKPTVGILWKSLVTHSRRSRYFSPFKTWKPVLDVKSVQYINLQYGDVAAEMAEAKALGFNIWSPPELDLKNDLDDLAALCAALDLVVGPSNATTNIAAACGAHVWFINEPYAWTQLSTDHLPWYPQAKVFNPATLEDWSPVMQEIAAKISTLRTGAF